MDSRANAYLGTSSGSQGYLDRKGLTQSQDLVGLTNAIKNSRKKQTSIPRKVKAPTWLGRDLKLHKCS